MNSSENQSKICGQMIETLKSDARAKDFAKKYRKELRDSGEYVPRKMDDLFEEMFRNEDYDWMKEECRVLSSETTQALKPLYEEYTAI